MTLDLILSKINWRAILDREEDILLQAFEEISGSTGRITSEDLDALRKRPFGRYETFYSNAVDDFLYRAALHTQDLTAEQRFQLVSEIKNQSHIYCAARDVDLPPEDKYALLNRFEDEFRIYNIVLYVPGLLEKHRFELASKIKDPNRTYNLVRAADLSYAHKAILAKELKDEFWIDAALKKAA